MSSVDTIFKGKRWLQPLLLLFAIALHGLVLTLPMPDLTKKEAPEEPTPKEITPRPEAIKVARLPRVKPDEKPVPPIEEQPVQPAQPEPEPDPEPEPPAPESKPAPEPPAPTPDSLPEPDPPTTPAPPPSLDERLQDFGSYMYAPEGTDFVSFGSQQNLWLEQLRDKGRQNLPDVGSFASPLRLNDDPLEVDYPLDECLDPEPQDPSFGVMLTDAGDLLEDPFLLQSSGYSVLDDKALEEVNLAFLPNPDNLEKPFTVSVKINYSCTS